MLDNEDYIEITKLFLDDNINDIAFYMMMFKGYDGWTCTKANCNICGDRIIPQDNQTSVNYCEICLV
jgi:hypothetical protein